MAYHCTRAINTKPSSVSRVPTNHILDAAVFPATLFVNTDIRINSFLRVTV